MGLLDDAIREHLELKRRRGADPSEIERAERDALGPVRRAPEDVEPDLAPDGTNHEQAEYEYGYEAEPGPGEHYVKDFGPPVDAGEGEFSRPPAGDHARPHLEEEPDPETGALYEDAALEYEPEPGHYEPEPGHEPGHLESEPAHVDPEHPVPEPPPPAGEHVGPETAEYDVEGEPGEDVLEETPEFLQDTPEHDRLWFEQRPPRNFDFDN